MLYQMRHAAFMSQRNEEHKEKVWLCAVKYESDMKLGKSMSKKSKVNRNTRRD